MWVVLDDQNQRSRRKRRSWIIIIGWHRAV